MPPKSSTGSTATWAPTTCSRPCGLLKVGEEYGEAISAWIGLQGQNPRKEVNADLDDVQGELCDVILAAAVALLSITGDTTSAVNVLDRITA